MKNKKTIYHFVIDQSGSMSGSEGQTIEGFNSQLKTLQQLKSENTENEYIVSVTYFEDEVTDIVQFKAIEHIQMLSRENYKPGGLTALYDGIGQSIDAIRKKYDSEIKQDLATVVMVILTDGGENASKFYTQFQIAEMIKELDKTGRWTFSFLGADLDAAEASNNLNINQENIISFNKENYAGMMDQMSSSIRRYDILKSEGKMTSMLFDDIEEKDQRKEKPKKNSIFGYLFKK
jgi:uncharacterized protein YegL